MYQYVYKYYGTIDTESGNFGMIIDHVTSVPIHCFENLCGYTQPDNSYYKGDIGCHLVLGHVTDVSDAVSIPNTNNIAATHEKDIQ